MKAFHPVAEHMGNWLRRKGIGMRCAWICCILFTLWVSFLVCGMVRVSCYGNRYECECRCWCWCALQTPISDILCPVQWRLNVHVCPSFVRDGFFLLLKHFFPNFFSFCCALSVFYQFVRNHRPLRSDSDNGGWWLVVTTTIDIHPFHQTNNNHNVYEGIWQQKEGYITSLIESCEACNIYKATDTTIHICDCIWAQVILCSYRVLQLRLLNNTPFNLPNAEVPPHRITSIVKNRWI